MSDCLSLIDTHADINNIKTWSQVSQMTNVVHTEELSIISCASGYLEVEPFCVPDIDCRIIGYLVYHCCGTGKIHSWTEEVICHLYQSDSDTCVKLDCWELGGKEYQDKPEICWNPNPCERLNELRCCLMNRKDGMKTSWSFRDSSGSTSYLSEKALMQLIGEADAECDALSCRNSRCISYSCPTC